MKCNRIAAVALAAAAAAFSFGATAQPYPSRTVTLIYPFGTSNAEVWMRQVAGEMQGILGQPMVVENRPGAGGRLGLQAMTTGKPDGYQLSIATTSMLVYSPLTSETFKPEPVKDYAPLTQVYNLNLGWWANANAPFKDAKGLVAYAKANPGKLNFGSTGVGSTGHFALELLNVIAGTQITHIPYKGEAQLIQATFAGEIHLFFTSGGKQYADAGKLQVIASSGNTRWKLFPERPTMKESGVDVVITQWMGVVAPPGTPADILNKLAGAFSTAMKAPHVMKLSDGFGAETVHDSSPEKFTALVRSELKVLEPIVRKTGIKTP